MRLQRMQTGWIFQSSTSEVNYSASLAMFYLGLKSTQHTMGYLSNSTDMKSGETYQRRKGKTKTVVGKRPDEGRHCVSLISTFQPVSRE